MRYLSNAGNDPEQTVSYWLSRHDVDGTAGFWLESGFFSIDGIEYFRRALESAKARSGEIRIVIGSNRGLTLGTAVSELLDTLGTAENASIGIVKYSNAFFHPKVVVLELPSGLREAYVGSANATAAGFGGLHVESGLALYESAGDESSVIDAIQAGVSRWFQDTPPGFHLVRDHDDVLALEELGILGLPDENLNRGAARILGSGTLGARRRLLCPPRSVRETETEQTVVVEVPEYGDSVAAPVGAPVANLKWSKKISASDAQRKKTGNQRGGITLVEAGHNIDSGSWFRDELFGDLSWSSGQTRTGQPREEAWAQAEVRFPGHVGETMTLKISHAPNREQGKHNYVSLLHLGAMAPRFASTDFTGYIIEIARLETGTFVVEIRQGGAR